MTNPMLRVLVCAVIAVSLNVHAAVASPSTDGRGGFAQILAGTPQLPAIHANRANQRLDTSKRRNSAYSACVLPTASGPAADRGHIGIVLQNGERPPFLSVGRSSGRSPPNRIS
jgi:hypothetical protein